MAKWGGKFLGLPSARPRSPGMAAFKLAAATLEDQKSIQLNSAAPKFSLCSSNSLYPWLAPSWKIGFLLTRIVCRLRRIESGVRKPTIFPQCSAVSGLGLEAELRKDLHRFHYLTTFAAALPVVEYVPEVVLSWEWTTCPSLRRRHKGFSEVGDSEGLCLQSLFENIFKRGVHHNREG